MLTHFKKSSIFDNFLYMYIDTYLKCQFQTLKYYSKGTNILNYNLFNRTSNLDGV